MRPSASRINYYDTYVLHNLRLTTWGENNLQSYRDRKSGINGKSSHKIMVNDTIYPSKNSVIRKFGISMTSLNKKT